MSEWYETFFDALAFDVWRALVPAGATDAEAAFLIQHLGRPGGAPVRLLDVPCGDGRLALPVAAAGHDVVGVDLSGVAIDRLQQAAAGIPTVSGRLGDMRHLVAALGGCPRSTARGAWATASAT